MSVAIYVTYKFTRDQFNPNGKIYSAFIDFEDKMDVIKTNNTTTLEGAIPAGVLDKAKEELYTILHEDVSILSYNILLGDAMYVNPYCTVNDPINKTEEPINRLDRPTPPATQPIIQTVNPLNDAAPVAKEGIVEIDKIPAGKMFPIGNCVIMDWIDDKNVKHRSLVKIPTKAATTIDGFMRGMGDKKRTSAMEMEAYDTVRDVMSPALNIENTVEVIGKINPQQYKVLGDVELIISEGEEHD